MADRGIAFPADMPLRLSPLQPSACPGLSLTLIGIDNGAHGFCGVSCCWVALWAQCRPCAVPITPSHTLWTGFMCWSVAVINHLGFGYWRRKTLMSPPAPVT